jgi:hypothetical protein
MTDWTDDGQEDERWGVAKIKNLPGTKLSKGTGIRVKMVNILFLYCQGFC